MGLQARCRRSPAEELISAGGCMRETCPWLPSEFPWMGLIAVAAICLEFLDLRVCPADPNHSVFLLLIWFRIQEAPTSASIAWRLRCCRWGSCRGLRRHLEAIGIASVAPRHNTQQASLYRPGRSDCNQAPIRTGLASPGHRARSGVASISPTSLRVSSTPLQSRYLLALACVARFVLREALELRTAQFEPDHNSLGWHGTSTCRPDLEGSG